MIHPRARRRSLGRAAHGASAAGALLLVAALFTGCAGPALAPLGRAPPRDAAASAAHGAHTVRDGDTLYAIAWRYGLDYRDLSRWNGVPEPYTIHPGQRLRISRPARLPRMPPSRAPPGGERADPPAAVPETAPRSTVRRVEPEPRKPRPARAAGSAVVKAWAWPARGKVVGAFGGEGGKGIDIEGPRGSPVQAAAPGFVVYSGSGLRGYGKLIIVKHNKRYLSAYAHNDRLHAKEGDTVMIGQRIADMGSTDARGVKLHFEIRRDGKPVDPVRFLPR